MDDAYELLEKAENARTKVQAIKYAKEADDMCPEGLELEKDRLKKEEQFKKIILDIFMEYLKPNHIFGVYMQKQIT